jgi:hypothetical protein
MSSSIPPGGDSLERSGDVVSHRALTPTRTLPYQVLPKLYEYASVLFQRFQCPVCASLMTRLQCSGLFLRVLSRLILVQRHSITIANNCQI